MNIKSSKGNMNTSLEILKKIKKVEVSEQLYDSVLQKIEAQKKLVIQPVWVMVASVALLAFLSLEVYIVKQNHTIKVEKSIEYLVEIPNNSLYNE